MSAKHVFKDSHDYEQDTLTALLQHLADSTTALADNVVSNTTEVYSSQEIALLEFNKLFRSRVYFAGISSDLPESGSFFVVNDGAKEVLATRDHDGVFRAFINACPHRGSPIALKKNGKVANNTFICAFHGWSFSSDGTLRAIAQNEKFGNTANECIGLIQLPAVEKFGMLWIHTEPAGVIDLDNYLGHDLCKKLENLEFDQMKTMSVKDYEMNCNWKLGVDGFGESYHFSSLHRRTLGAVMHSHTTLFDVYNDIHFRTVIASHDIDKLSFADKNSWNISDGAVVVYFVFPNTVFIIMNGSCAVQTMTPQPNTSSTHLVRLATYAYSDVNESELEEIARRDKIVSSSEKLYVPEFTTIADILNLITIEEDYGLAEKLQKQYETSVTSVLYGRNEPGLQVFHKTLRAKLHLPPMKVLNED